LVFDSVNAGGGVSGHKIAYHVVNDASDPSTSVTAARQLINAYGDKLLFGGIYDPLALPVASLAQAQHILYYNPAASTPDLTHPTRQYVFDALPSADVQNSVIVQFLQSLKATHIGAIVETSGFGQSHAAQLTGSLTNGASVVQSSTISPDATTAADQVLAMQSAKVDAIVWEGASINAAVAIIRAAHQYGVNIPIVTFGAGTSPATDDLLTQVPVEYYSVTPLACALTSPCASTFVNAYKARFSDTPSIWTAQGYAAAEAFVAALKATSDFSPDGVVRALQALSYSTPLLPAPVTFSASNHMGGSTMFFQGYKGGKLFFFGNDINDNKFAG
jgi:branched-chain amino acid transport system substrate-binding protein